MLGQRRRRWANIDPTVVQGIVFAGYVVSPAGITIIVQEVVFFTWIGILIFGTKANINLLGLMIQKSFGAIFSVAIKGHHEVI